jgi:Transposase DDE domain
MWSHLYSAIFGFGRSPIFGRRICPPCAASSSRCYNWRANRERRGSGAWRWTGARSKRTRRSTRRCPRGPLPKTATIVDWMSRKLHTKTGAAVYAARKGIVEPVIGQIKQARGFRQFLLRGIRQGARGMVVAVYHAQHSQTVSPLRVNGEAFSLFPGRPRSRTPTRPSPRAATDMVGAQHDVT